MITQVGDTGNVTWGQLKKALNNVKDDAPLLDAPILVSWIGEQVCHSSNNLCIALGDESDPVMAGGTIDVKSEGVKWDEQTVIKGQQADSERYSLGRVSRLQERRL